MYTCTMRSSFQLETTNKQNFIFHNTRTRWFFRSFCGDGLSIRGTTDRPRATTRVRWLSKGDWRRKSVFGTTAVLLINQPEVSVRLIKHAAETAQTEKSHPETPTTFVSNSAIKSTVIVPINCRGNNQRAFFPRRSRCTLNSSFFYKKAHFFAT